MTTKDFYENNYSWDEEKSDDASWVYKFWYLDKIIEHKKISSFIDVWAWKWKFIDSIKNILKDNTSYSAIELSTNAAKILERKWYKTFNIDISSEEKIDIWKYDLITCFHVLEHVFLVDNFMLSLKNMLNNDWILVLEIPNLWYWVSRLLLLFWYTPFQSIENHDKRIDFWVPGLFRKKLEKYYSAGHIRWFTLKWLVDMMKYYWFDILKIEWHGSNSLLPACLSHNIRIYCKVWKK